MWLVLILDSFVKNNYLTWERLEHLVRNFRFKGRDRANGPAVPMARKMKQGPTHKKKFPGKFAQVSTFITLSTLVSTTFLRLELGCNLVQLVSL